MEAVVRFTLRQQVLFNLLFVLAMVVGAFSIADLAVERYPNVNMGKVYIGTFYPGASARDVEALVTRKIEQALEDLEDVEFVRASSVRERSSITVKFRDDSDYEKLYSELRFRVLGMLGELPPEVEPPRFNLLSLDDWVPVVCVNLLGERSNRALKLIAEQLQAPLRRIPGVKDARISGAWTREFHVLLDPRKLAVHGVTFEEVSAALIDANQVIPAGSFTDDSGEFAVRVDERFRSREQLVSTLVRRDADGSFVRVEDLIDSARLDYRKPHVIDTVNGRDTVTIRVLKTPEGNALTIRRAVDEIVAEYRPLLAAENVDVTFTQDSTGYIQESMSTLGWNLIVGIVLVGLILWYFMGPRNAGLVTIGIPFAFLTTMIFMRLTGNSLNEITLFSFVLVSGIIVDDAIVVVDNIYRRIQEGAALDQAIINGTAEVALPVISSTATTIVAFLPMLLMTGSTGEFFALIPKAIAFALIASLFEALLILPLHYLDFGPRPAPRALDLYEQDNTFLRLVRPPVNRLVRITMRHRWLTLGTVVLSFLAALAILAVSITGVVPLVRIKFFPDDYNRYYVFIEGPPDTPLTVTDAKVRAISADLMSEGPGFAESAAGFAGFIVTEDYEEQFGRHLGMVMVALPAKERRAFADPLAHLERIRDWMNARHGGGGFEIRVRAEKDGPPAGKDVNIQVIGNDDAAVENLAEALVTAMRAEPSVAPYLIQLDDGRAVPERVLRLEVDAPRAREFGLTQGQAARLAAAVLDGRYLGDYRLADEEIDLKLGIAPAFIDAPEAALGIPVLEHPSGPVYLRDIVRPVVERQPSELHRYRGSRSRSITANLKPGAPISAASVVAWAKNQYQTLAPRHPGATLVFGGEFEDTQRSFQSLTQAFGVAVLLIYLILATQFHSYTQPLLILSAVMFSIVGVVFGKLITQSLFTVNSFIAVVGVTGVVVNDSLVLLDFINRRYRDGLSRTEAIQLGIDQRLRPILVTTITTVLGLLPMAVGFPSYSVIWGSMASTFVTGLATATLLTLFVVPVAWDLLTEFQERRAGRAFLHE